MSNAEMTMAMHEAEKAAVLSRIPVGYDRARIPNDSRMIARMTRIPERKVLQLIEALRNEGHLICNRQDGFGYFLAENEADVLRQYRQDCARAMSILRRIKPFRHYLKRLDEQNGDQITWEDLALEEIISKGEL